MSEPESLRKSGKSLEDKDKKEKKKEKKEKKKEKKKLKKEKKAKEAARQDPAPASAAQLDDAKARVRHSSLTVALVIEKY